MCAIRAAFALFDALTLDKREGGRASEQHQLGLPAKPKQGGGDSPLPLPVNMLNDRRARKVRDGERQMQTKHTNKKGTAIKRPQHSPSSKRSRSQRCQVSARARGGRAQGALVVSRGRGPETEGRNFSVASWMREAERKFLATFSPRPACGLNSWISLPHAPAARK